MNKKLLTYVLGAIGILVGVAGALVGFGVFRGSNPTTPIPENLSKGVAISREGTSKPQAELEKTIAAIKPTAMKQSGLAGAVGGVRVRLTSGEAQEVLLAIPQLVDGQAPIAFFISSNPSEAVTEFRLRKREDSNVVVSVRLAGGANKEVQLAWSAVVLLASREITPNKTPADPYAKATACVQAEAAEITKLAAELWPKSGKAGDFAASIQGHVRAMKRKAQPRSLDALGILQSGDSSICTANANLAAALMRSKGIACRSIAVIPPISQKLEMHRIVEFFDDGRWHPFDPSSLQADIPSKPWHNIIMSKTTIADEQVAMKPRMGSMVGCPYGQELEMLTSGVHPFGQDFFWTMAKPLAQFEPSEEATRLAAEAWNRYLETGTLSPGQLQAASAKTADELLDALRKK